MKNFFLPINTEWLICFLSFRQIRFLKIVTSTFHVWWDKHFLILHGKWGIEVPPYICFPKLYLLLFSNKKAVYIIFIFITVHDYCIKKLLKHLWNSSKIINNWKNKKNIEIANMNSVSEKCYRKDLKLNLLLF